MGMKRKGFIEVQINWVFVLIAGAMILVVAFSFITKLRASSKVQIADTLVKDIEAIVSGAEVAKGGAQTVSVPKVNIEFSCTEDCSCGIRIGPAERPFKDKLIFAPDNLEDIEIIFLALEWKVPFRVGNFLFASNKFVKYFVLYDNDDGQTQEIIEMFKKKIPEGLKVDYVDLRKRGLGTLHPENFDEVKFVFVNTQGTPDVMGLDKFRRIDFNAVKITPPAAVSFFDKKSKKKLGFKGVTSAYLGEASLFAALFADNSVMYNCNMEKAIRRLGYIAQVYGGRAQQLYDESVQPDSPIGHCGPVANLPSYKTDVYEEIFQKMAQRAETLALNIEPKTAGKLTSYISQLEAANQRFLLGSCPLLY